MMVEIASFDIFDDEEKCRSYVPQIFEYITTNTNLTMDQILTQFIPTKRHLLGVKGSCPQ